MADAVAPLVAFPDGLRAPQRWLDGILPRCPGATADLVKHELLTTLRDFCMVGRVWTRWLLPVTVTPGVTRFAIEPRVDDDVPEDDADVLVTHVVAAKWSDDDEPLMPRDRQRSVRGRLSHWGRTGYSLFEPGVLELFDPPRVERPLVLLAVLTPNSLAVPEWLVSQHYDAITAGTLERLYTIPGIFYKADEATRCGRRYRALRAVALSRSMAAYTDVGGAQAWSYPGFGA